MDKFIHSNPGLESRFNRFLLFEDYAKYEEFMHQRYVAEELAKAKQQAADPDTQWADHESVWETLGKQYDV